MNRLTKTDLVPLAVALQALMLFVGSLFFAPDALREPKLAGVGSQSDRAPEPLTSLSELPRDLKREHLPVPMVPEREKRDEPLQPVPHDDASESTISEGPKLASLRTEEVAFRSPIAIAIAAPMLGAPDSLQGLSLADSGWLGRRSRGDRGSGRAAGPSDVGSGGRGGQGNGGFGGGSGGGGYCPTPGRIGGGGGSRGGGGTVATGSPGRPGGTSATGGGTGTTGSGSRGRPASPGSGGQRGKPRSKS